jgi:hypothetical protein
MCVCVCVHARARMCECGGGPWYFVTVSTVAVAEVLSCRKTATIVKLEPLLFPYSGTYILQKRVDIFCF